MQVSSIENVLNKFPNRISDNNPPPKKDREDNEKEKDNHQFFLDFTVYTVILDEDGNYQDLINHSENNVDTQKMKKNCFYYYEKS